jgi:hypothetical protein
MSSKYLRIYVNDHRAASRGGLALARRCMARNEGTPLAETLRSVADEIVGEIEVLDRVAGELGFRIDPVKVAAVRAGELAGRLKLNGQLRGYSPLSRLLEIEGLLAGIDAKRSLWRSLKNSLPAGFAGADFEALADQATAQRERLVPFHWGAAAAAFGGDRTAAAFGGDRTVDAAAPSAAGVR